MTKLTLTLLIGGVAVVSGGLGYAFRGGGTETATSVRSSLSDEQQTAMLEARTKGDPDAPIVVYEVSDFQCPYCRDFWEETLPLIDAEYVQTGKVRFTFLNFPLVQIHSNAAAAHEFAMCGAMQDRFWPIHDLLYRHQAAWSPLDDPSEFFFALADSADLSRERLEDCFRSGAVRELIRREVDLNWRAGVQSTPSFIIEDRLLAGAAPIDVWRPILDSIYQAKTEGGG
ncbi:MAG: DsbA family protein [Gemmatimonadales bacterium]